MDLRMLAEIRKEVEHGGAWLGSARKWMQSNVNGGDRLCWGSTDVVHIPFYKLEELAKSVAISAIQSERKRIMMDAKSAIVPPAGSP